MLPITQPLADLPEPSPEARAHSENLCGQIRADIAAHGGAASFARFMELALYAPGFGYYSAGARKFGAAGDFITAPELSPLFSRCLAAQCAQVLGALGGGDILEFGAGTGVMAADMLAELARLGQMPARYLILEVSAELRERQRRVLQERVPSLLPRIHWLDRLPAPLSGVIVANEVLDAMPANRFRRTAGGFEEITVSVEAGKFAWSTRPAPAELCAALRLLEGTLPAPLTAGHIAEICLGLPAFFRGLGEVLARGAVLAVDYGYTRAAYYHPQRHMGTLMCHYRQRAHDNPFLWVGLQDITTHVDFTAVAEAATAAGFRLAGYTTQAHFLLALGLAEQATDWRRAREVKLLTLPEEMGERFKAIAFLKALRLPLRGFALRDLSHTL